MPNQSLDQIAEQLRRDDNYRIIVKYKKPISYHFNDDKNISINKKKKEKLIGVFLDIETTGLMYYNDKLIELGMVKFEYTKDGHIFNLLEEFSGYQDPNILIPDYITKLTNITNTMVKGHNINENDIIKYLKDVDIIIAHNTKFDRAFFETSFPNVPRKSWACSMNDIDWNNEDISSSKLEYIAYRYNFFFKGHRAINDCLAGIHILAQELLISKIPVLKRLLDNSAQLQFQVWAKNSPYNSKDLLKVRGYRWSVHPRNNYRSWYIEVPESSVEKEIYYLRSNIYKNNTIIPIEVEIFDSFYRYSIINKHKSSINERYADKLIWVKELCENSQKK